MATCDSIRPADVGMSDGYTCTLPTGHDGEHHHHDGEAVCASWERDQVAEDRRVRDQQLRTAIAVNVRTWMKHRRVFGVELSRRVGVPYSTLSRKLRGSTSFYVDDLAGIAYALGISVVDLIFHTPEQVEGGEAA